MFGVFLGDVEHLTAWYAAARKHASTLGLVPAEGQHRLAEHRVLAWAWLLPASVKAPGHHARHDRLCVPTAPAPLRLIDAPNEVAGMQANRVYLSVVLPSGTIEVAVPPSTPEPFYHAHDGRGWMLANDFRWMTRWSGFELESTAVYALFQFGAIPAPFTLSQSVRRIPNGHTLAAGGTAGAHQLRLNRLDDEQANQPQPEHDPEAAVRQTLDGILGRVLPGPALLFSGGIDSSLLAARLVALGVPEVYLINYCFGPEDAEAEQAQSVAAHLGLRCEAVPYRPDDIVPMLERVWADYSFPFGDRSVIPTNLLVHATIAAMGSVRTVIDGTGADGAFGAWTPHSRIAALPRLARSVLASAYAQLGLWQQPSEAERVARLARGSLQWPSAQALVAAQNVLDEIAYRTPGHYRQALTSALHDHVEVLGRGLTPEGQLSVLDLVHVCAGIFAAKTFDPLRAAGLQPLYPFLEPSMFRLSAALSYADKTGQHEGKQVLKRLLARQLPRAYIERPKSGFVPPLRAILSRPAVQACARAAVQSDQNPLRPFYNGRIVSRMFDRTAAGQPLSNGSYKFLWTLIFASCWLRQAAD